MENLELKFSPLEVLANGASYPLSCSLLLMISLAISIVESREDGFVEGFKISNLVSS